MKVKSESEVAQSCPTRLDPIYLLIFAVVGLAIGLLIRKPFLGMNRFVSEKIEETEVL